MQCANHPKQRSTCSCIRCGKPLCKYCCVFLSKGSTDVICLDCFNAEVKSKPSVLPKLKHPKAAIITATAASLLIISIGASPDIENQDLQDAQIDRVSTVEKYSLESEIDETTTLYEEPQNTTITHEDAETIVSETSNIPVVTTNDKVQSITGKYSSNTRSTETISPVNEIIVYWLPDGKVYHLTPDCKTLKRSSKSRIKEGTIEESGKARPCIQCGNEYY